MPVYELLMLCVVLAALLLVWQVLYSPAGTPTESTGSQTDEAPPDVTDELAEPPTSLGTSNDEKAPDEDSRHAAATCAENPDLSVVTQPVEDNAGDVPSGPEGAEPDLMRPEPRSKGVARPAEPRQAPPPPVTEPRIVTPPPPVSERPVSARQRKKKQPETSRRKLRADRGPQPVPERPEPLAAKPVPVAAPVPVSIKETPAQPAAPAVEPQHHPALPETEEDRLRRAMAQSEAGGALADVTRDGLLLARLCLEEGRRPEAETVLRKMVLVATRGKLAAEHAEARIELASLACLDGDMTTACEHWQMAKLLFHELDRRADRERMSDMMTHHHCPTDWFLTGF